MKVAALFALLGASALVSGKPKKEPEPTTFNGVEVPPMTDLTPATYDEWLKSHTFVMVKHHR